MSIGMRGGGMGTGQYNRRTYKRHQAGQDPLFKAFRRQERRRKRKASKHTTCLPNPAPRTWWA